MIIINKINACRYTGLAKNIAKSKYMEVGRHQGMMANEHITVDNNPHKKVQTFKYLGT